VRQYVKWGFVAIGAYLILVHATGTKTAANSAGTNAVNVIKAFQGR
jgi:hypothetical protein